MPKNQAPEPLILKADNTIKQKIEKDSFNESPFNGTKRASAPLFREEVEALLQALKEERIPLGYKEMPISLVTLNDSYVLVRGLQGQTLSGFTYHVHNNTNGILALSEPKVARALPTKEKALVAILISKKTLNPGEETDVHVVARTH
jgi:hypothetical protein